MVDHIEYFPEQSLQKVPVPVHKIYAFTQKFYYVKKWTKMAVWSRDSLHQCSFYVLRGPIYKNLRKKSLV